MPETTMKVYDILNAGPRHKFMVRSKTTRQPMIVHNCLYGCGWKKLLHTATLWGVDVTPDLIQLVHAQYRVSHPPVVDTWDFFDDLLHRWASKDRFEDGESISIFEITAKGLRSPTGFLIQYPDLEASVRPFGRKFVRSYTYWNAARRSRANVHRGLVLENCIAAGSEVLTETRGWVAIETLQPDERVWNGDCWCSHKGLSYNNIQTTIDVQGVRMTPDHLVMTDSGWEKAENVGDKGVLYAKRKVHKVQTCV